MEWLLRLEGRTIFKLPFRERGHPPPNRADHALELLRRRAIRRHQDEDIANRPRQDTMLGHDLTYSCAGPFSKIERFSCPPILDQFDPGNQPNLPNISNLRQ